MSAFDPNAASADDSGVFGLPVRDDASVVLIPVPFEATTSYGDGAASGPSALLAASRQVDLLDREVGTPYEAGVVMLEESPDVRSWNSRAAEAVRAARNGDDRACADVDAACDALNTWLDGTATSLLDDGKIVGTIGGDHGSVYGAIAAHARRHAGLGILHVDAHADLRRSYEGFRFSHASILDAVTRDCPNVERVVQVGIRDYCDEERRAIEGSESRIVTFFDADLSAARFRGARFADQCETIVDQLPESVYVTFDIDGLDPTLCPNTGTPVPGGLSFAEASYLVGAVARSGRRIVGFDLAEVAPGPEGDEWDANVGARLLYKLIGWTLISRRA